MKSRLNDGNIFAFRTIFFCSYSSNILFSNARKRERESDEDGSSKKQKKRKDEKLPPLPAELVSKMKALIDYIVEYEDT